MTDNGRFNVLGTLVNAIELDQAAEQVILAARERRPLGLSALAVHGVICGVDDPTLQFRLNQLELVVPDGQPVRWALKWLYGAELAERVYGPDLMTRVCERAAQQGLSVYLYGSTPHTLAELTRRMGERFPKLRIAGAKPSRFRPADEAERLSDLREISQSGANLVFVGLGCPRQEIWAYENRLDLSMPVLAVGAAFDYQAGTLRRPPAWMQQSGLEWVARLVQEPRRLWRRYLLLNPRFLFLLALQLAGLRRFQVERARPPGGMLRPG